MIMIFGQGKATRLVFLEILDGDLMMTPLISGGDLQEELPFGIPLGWMSIWQAQSVVSSLSPKCWVTLSLQQDMLRGRLPLHTVMQKRGS